MGACLYTGDCNIMSGATSAVCMTGQSCKKPDTGTSSYWPLAGKGVTIILHVKKTDISCEPSDRLFLIIISPVLKGC